jgi:hypothetical protein
MSPVRATWKALRSLWAIVIAYALSVGALGLAYTANTTALHEADTRAKQIEGQNERLRIAFCGIVEPFANSPTQPSTAAGQTLRDSFKRAASSEGLGCTPDPTDGR